MWINCVNLFDLTNHMTGEVGKGVLEGKGGVDSGGFSTSSLVQEVPVENLKYDNFIVNITTTPLS
jgi:hypothetical protein